MGTRSHYPIFFLVVILGFGTSVFLLPEICHDPSGCLRFNSSEPAAIGIGVLTSGESQPISMEVYQAARLAADSDLQQSLLLAIRPFYSACPSDGPLSSTVEMAASSSLLVVLGPTCAEDAANFAERMKRSGKAFLSIKPWALPTGLTAPGISPQVNELARQSMRWLDFLAFTDMVILPTGDPNSQALSEALCAAFASSSKKCTLLLAGQEPPPDLQVDGIAEIDLVGSAAAEINWQDLWPGKPAIKISLSRPMTGASEPGWDYWIAPTIWDVSQNIVQKYKLTYGSPMSNLAGIASFESIPIIEQALQETGVRHWDGSWLVPRMSFSQKLTEVAGRNELFKPDCEPSAPSCPTTVLGLYQLRGNEYRFNDP